MQQPVHIHLCVNTIKVALLSARVCSRRSLKSKVNHSIRTPIKTSFVRLPTDFFNLIHPKCVLRGYHWLTHNLNVRVFVKWVISLNSDKNLIIRFQICLVSFEPTIPNLNRTWYYETPGWKWRLLKLLQSCFVSRRLRPNAFLKHELKFVICVNTTWKIL